VGPLAAGSSVHWAKAASGLTFNCRTHDELPNGTLVFGIDHAHEAVARWTQTTKTDRPHFALDYLRRAGCAAQLTAMGRI
jgi:hypothetical protein